MDESVRLSACAYLLYDRSFALSVFSLIDTSEDDVHVYELRVHAFMHACM